MNEFEATEAGPDGKAPAPVRRGARHQPEALALVGPNGEELSYGTLDAAVERVAQRLRKAGVGAGDRVACLLPRTPAYVVLLLALWRRAAVAVPLPARTPPSGQVRLLKTVAAHALVVQGAAPDAPPSVSVLPARDFIGDLGRPTGAVASAPPENAAFWPTGRAMTLVFTSGSTGTPKAALHTVGNHFFSAEGSQHNLALVPGDRWLLALPLYHVGGLAIVLRCLWAGATVVFPREDESTAAAIRRTEATHVSFVAAQLRRLLDAIQEEGPEAYCRLKVVLLGGGPVPPAFIEEARRVDLPIAVSYGLTEMTSQVATTALDDAIESLLHTAGRPLPHRRVRIRADADGETGEILVQGRTRFAGYLVDGHLQEPFVEAFGEPGWFATGDLGRFDASGRLRVVGRRDRRFVSGGENVQPEEIEEALRRLPEVADAAVVPVSHETFGQRPVAFIRGQREPFPLGEQVSSLREVLQEVLPKYKVPDAFYPWPAEAEGDMKPDRALLRRIARQRYEKKIENGGG